MRRNVAAIYLACSNLEVVSLDLNFNRLQIMSERDHV
jgi:proline dehydrogenase